MKSVFDLQLFRATPKGRSMKHTHSCASNTDEVWRTVIGCRIKGVVKDTSRENSTDILVLECGHGLAFCSTGAHWIVSPSDVQRFVSAARDRLERNQRELEGVLVLAGER